MKRFACTALTAALFALLPRPGLTQVILSEVMYNPSGVETATEYVELFNAGAAPVTLLGWSLGDGSAIDDIVAAPDGDGSTTLAPGRYALILDSDYWSAGEGHYDSVLPDTTLLLTTGDAALGSAGLANGSSETISLYNFNGDQVSARSYLPDADDGISEERIDPDGSEADSNWAFSVPGGSAGRANSVTPPPVDLAIVELNASLFEMGAERGLQLQVRLRNEGLENSGADRLLSTRLYASEHAEFHHPLPALAPGQEHELNRPFLPIPSGLHRFRAKISDREGDPAGNNLALLDHALSALPGEVRLREVYGAAGDGRDVEWIELGLGSADSLRLDGWSIRRADGQQLAIDSSADRWLRPGEPLLLAPDLALLEQWEGVPEGRLHLPEGWPQLTDNGVLLTLLDVTGAQVDQALLPAFESGRAFFRLDSTNPPSVDEWQLMPDSLPGTPGVEYRQPQADLLEVVSFRLRPDESGELTWMVLTIEVENPLDRSVEGALELSMVGSDGRYEVTTLSLELLPAERVERSPLSMLVEQSGRFWAGYRSVDGSLTGETESWVAYPEQSVVISEFMPQPDVGGEWIELFNRSGDYVGVGGWAILDAAFSETQLPERLGLESGEALVVAQDSAALAAAWPSIDTDRIVQASSWAVLNDDGDELTLWQSTHYIGDEISSYPTSREGVAFVRTPSSYDRAATADDLGFSRAAAGGTPGMVSGSEQADPTLSAPRVEIWPNPFGQAFRLTLELPVDDATITLRLFDSAGRHVGTPVQDRPFSSFDAEASGRSFLVSRSLPVGLYVWHLTIDAGADGRWERKGALASNGGIDGIGIPAR